MSNKKRLPRKAKKKQGWEEIPIDPITLVQGLFFISNFFGALLDGAPEFPVNSGEEKIGIDNVEDIPHEEIKD